MTKKGNKLLVLFGADIRKIALDHPSVVVSAEGQNRIKQDKISGKFSAVAFHGHGNVQSRSRKKYPNTQETSTINLIEDKNKTIDNILFLQGKTEAEEFYVLSCYTGSTVNDIKKSISELQVGTTIILGASSKHTSLSSNGNDFIRKISEASASDQKAYPEKLFIENILRDPGTYVFCRVIKDKDGSNKLVTLKVVSPKEKADMADIKQYLKSGRAIQIDKDSENDEDHKNLRDELQQILEAEIKSFDEQKYKNKALIEAVHRNLKDRVDGWLENGADVNGMLSDGATPLYMACLLGNKDIAELLLANGAEVNKADKSGSTPLYIACHKGRKDITELLLANGADVNQVDRVALLYMACVWGNKEIAELLLANGADANQADKDGETLLYKACLLGNKEIAELLLANGAEVNQADKSGATPLYIACHRGRKDIAELLLANGADANQVDRVALLYKACLLGNKEIAELLLANGADANQADKNGETLLYIACDNGCKYIAELLLANGVDANQADKNGLTPLYIARDNGHEEIAELLLENGAKMIEANLTQPSPSPSVDDSSIETLNNKKSNNKGCCTIL